MTHSDGGKGSDRRPGEGYADGWDRIFGGKKKDKQNGCKGDCSHCSRSASASESKAGAARASMCGDPLKGSHMVRCIGNF